MTPYDLPTNQSVATITWKTDCLSLFKIVASPGAIQWNSWIFAAG